MHACMYIAARRAPNLGWPPARVAGRGLRAQRRHILPALHVYAGARDRCDPRVHVAAARAVGRHHLHAATLPQRAG